MDRTRRRPAGPRSRALPPKSGHIPQTTQEPDRLFAYYDWGGYAIWKLDSRYHVFADGRADLYGNEILRECIETVTQLHQGWGQVLDHWNVGTILVPPSSPLAQALFLDPDWTAAYRDLQAVVFVRAPNKPVRATLRKMAIIRKNVY